MSEYIDIPRPPTGHFSQRSQPSYGRPDGYGQSNSIPRVTRVSYGTTGAGTTANPPSWGPNAYPVSPVSPLSPVSRPTSTPLLAAGDQSTAQTAADTSDPRTRKSSRSQSSRAFGQPSPGPSDALSLPNSPPPRPWTANTNPDIGMPTRSWVSSSFAAHPESILSPDSPYPLHPPPSRFGDFDHRNTEQRRPELYKNEGQQEQSYCDDDHHSPPLSRQPTGSHSVVETMSVSDVEDMNVDPTEPLRVANSPPADPIPPTPYRMVGNVYTPPEPPKRPGMGSRFVGGFVAGLKWIPNAMSRSKPLQAQDAVPVPMPMPMPQPQVQPQLPVASPGSPPRLGNLPYEVHHPATAQHERIPLRDSEFTTDTTTSSGPPRTPPDTALPNPHDPSSIDVLETPASIASPVDVEPQYASDYDAMSRSPEPEEASLSSRANRVGKFVKDFAHLPWIGSHVATEYNPAESARAQQDKPSESWYTKRGHQRLDLLEGPAPARPQMQQRSRALPSEVQQSRSNPQPRAHTGARPRQRHRANTAGSEVATAIRPTRTPASATSAGVVPPSPGASSHGKGSHAYSYSYYYSSPQPLYVYPSAVSPQMVPPQLRRPDGSGSPPQELAQAVPVYMLATPAPIMMPSPQHHRSSSRNHRPGHHHPMPKMTSPNKSPKKV